MSPTNLLKMSKKKRVFLQLHKCYKNTRHGRSIGIRTRGLLDPNQARYQTSPYPEIQYIITIILRYVNHNIGFSVYVQVNILNFSLPVLNNRIHRQGSGPLRTTAEMWEILRKGILPEWLQPPVRKVWRQIQKKEKSILNTS